MRAAVVALLIAVSPVSADPVAGPAPELLAAARAQAGTYRCTGHVAVDGDRTRAVTARLVIALDLDRRWLVWRLTQLRTRGTPRPMRYVIHRGFDAASRTWHAVQLDNTGGRAELTSPDGEVWTGTLTARDGSAVIRDHQRLVGGVLHLTGEYEVEPGVYDDGYEVTCRR